MSTLYDYGPTAIDLRLVNRRDFSMVVDVEGDRSADTFAASLQPAKRPHGVTAFTVTVGAYDAGDDTTPVTVSLADTTLDAMEAGAWVWDLKWTTAGGLERTIAAGDATILAAITP